MRHGPVGYTRLAEATCLAFPEGALTLPTLLRPGLRPGHLPRKGGRGRRTSYTHL